MEIHFITVAFTKRLPKCMDVAMNKSHSIIPAKIAVLYHRACSFPIVFIALVRTEP